MKKLLIGLLVLGSISANAVVSVDYGVWNEDITSIRIIGDNLQECEEKLAEVRDLVVSRNKVIIKPGKCKAFGEKLHGNVVFHKYL